MSPEEISKGNTFWNLLNKNSLENLWEKEDKIWDKIATKNLK